MEHSIKPRSGTIDAVGPGSTGEWLLGALRQLGKASDLAKMSKIELGVLLGQRGIPRHYGEEVLAQDLEYARGVPRLACLRAEA